MHLKEKDYKNSNIMFNKFTIPISFNQCLYQSTKILKPHSPPLEKKYVKV